MARQVDATAVTVLTKLLDKLTDKHETHQDGAAVQQMKAFCKQSDENIILTSTALLHRLKEEHAQVPHACPSHRYLPFSLLYAYCASHYPASIVLPLLHLTL